MYSVSVCMASYNGGQYISEQIDSILPQLNNDDELIIVDDGSTDLTLEIIKDYSNPMIKLYANRVNLGVVDSFEKSLSLASGDIIILSDQDDIWLPGRVQAVRDTFRDIEGASVVVVNAYLMHDDRIDLETFYEVRRSGAGMLKNLYKNTYIGCCMAVRREVLELALPFPKHITMHDQWLGLVGELCGKSTFLEDRFVVYRRHGGNLTGLTRGKIKSVINKRLIAASMVAEAYGRKIFGHKTLKEHQTECASYE
ncbi:glycosyltransferase family 2 protein [Deinococcus sp. SDU3-2]|uniref:Glycosyltransferase family 2 protein n=1 Tax=Deinococcus terrestris TaxID=2651870 RepID=A0A7X1NXR3_9DEIO|nr:glycosyltransferase family 2 protein [Deinococcus terrestris]MPY67638.1 glycosyltransferase family 2 protein [Deinococcus terrestris]